MFLWELISETTDPNCMNHKMWQRSIIITTSLRPWLRSRGTYRDEISLQCKCNSSSRNEYKYFMQIRSAATDSSANKHTHKLSLLYYYVLNNGVSLIKINFQINRSEPLNGAQWNLRTVGNHWGRQSACKGIHNPQWFGLQSWYAGETYQDVLWRVEDEARVGSGTVL